MGTASYAPPWPSLPCLPLPFPLTLPPLPFFLPLDIIENGLLDRGDFGDPDPVLVGPRPNPPLLEAVWLRGLAPAAAASRSSALSLTPSPPCSISRVTRSTSPRATRPSCISLSTIARDCEPSLAPAPTAPLATAPVPTAPPAAALAPAPVTAPVPVRRTLSLLGGPTILLASMPSSSVRKGRHALMSHTLMNRVPGLMISTTHVRHPPSRMLEPRM